MARRGEVKPGKRRRTDELGSFSKYHARGGYGLLFARAFNVNMQPQYGEGAKNAFYRLQIEIMKFSEDESLFAWTSEQGGSGLLAAQPSYFMNSGDIVEETCDMSGSRPPYSMTNKGLEIALPKKHLKLALQDSRKVPFFLRCSRASTSPKAEKALYIELDFGLKGRAFGQRGKNTQFGLIAQR